MSVIPILKFITGHPLTKNNRLNAISRFLKWQIASRIFPYPVIYPFIGNSRLIIWRGLTGATGNIYVGLMEFEEMAFLLHFIKEDDLFADIGANVGSYTVLASGHKKARTISFEPIPTTFYSLKNNVVINHIEGKVKLLNIGLGAAPSVLKFTSSLDTVNHVASNNEGKEELLEVKVDTLDNTLEGEVPLLMKIDVEGFESEVLKGAIGTLSNNSLKAIIIELNGSGQRYGFDDNDIKKQLSELGFTAYQYEPFTRKLNKISTQLNGNVIYLRDLEFVQERIKTSAAIQIFGHSI